MKAICVDDSGTNGYPGLIQGRTYNVTLHPTSTWAVFVEGVPHPYGSHGWDKTRFKIQEEPLKPVLDLTKPVQTKDGQAVTILSQEAQGPFSIVGLLGGYVYQWDKEGRRCGSTSKADLVNVPPKPRVMTAEMLLYQTAAGKIIVTVLLPGGDLMGAGAQARILGRKTITITEGEGMGDKA